MERINGRLAKSFLLHDYCLGGKMRRGFRIQMAMTVMLAVANLLCGKPYQIRFLVKPLATRIGPLAGRSIIKGVPTALQGVRPVFTVPGFIIFPHRPKNLQSSVTMAEVSGQSGIVFRLQALGEVPVAENSP